MSIQARIKKSFEGFFLDIDFETGNDIVGLLGASGCGKSMTLKCIAGIVRPDEGRIAVDGITLFDSEKKINVPPQKRRVGLLFQNYALFPNMTVKQNIMSVLALNTDKDDREQRFAGLADKFYLLGLENHYPAQLSGGQQQRTALARIMASAPSVLMLDEPLSALDNYLRWRLESELMQILEEFGGTTLYVSHNRDEVYRLCKKVCVVDRGRNEEIRTVKELFDSPETLASSLLSGCKNYSRAQRIDSRTVRALDWNADLRCGADIGENIRYIGVRAHYIAPAKAPSGSSAKNILACRVLRITEDVFSAIVNLAPIHSDSNHDFSQIRMELSKREAENIHAGDILPVEIDPADILLLRG